MDFLTVFPLSVFSYARIVSAEWVGRRSNPRLRFFRPPLDRLSYRPVMGVGRERDEQTAWANKKRPGVALTPGLVALRKEWAMRHLRP